MDIREIKDYIISKGIELVNFMYPAADGRLKTLNFVIPDEDYLLSILNYGERVDGSSLFPSVGTGNSDLYVVPRLETMFEDPFAARPTICFLCSYRDKNGERARCSPEYTLLKAKEAFRSKTGMDFEAMGEMEFYVSAPEDEKLSMYMATDQRGYHESAPFAKFNDFRTECMLRIMKVGGKIKYGHSEVGNFRLNGRIYEQNEIEFLPCDVLSAADQLILAKWIIRCTAAEYGLDVSFAPKMTSEKAGSGLHIHMRIVKEGKNVLIDGQGNLSQTAKKAIAGMMMLAPSITAFGNANPLSYLRLVPHQEAPTLICWGDRNRSVLVRVPLGWKGDKQTVEIRSADSSADVYQLLAALCVACMHGIESKDAEQIAAKTYVDVDVHKNSLHSLDSLPSSCADSAQMLEKHREIYEKDGIFSPEVIDSVLHKLRSYSDENLRERLALDPSLEPDLVKQYYYCG